jgi:hypothetical protein
VLLLATVFVVAKTYRLWWAGPWDLPKPGKAKEPSVLEGSQKQPPPARLVSTKDIIERNLFDPERKGGTAQESDTSSAGMHRLRGMVLLGTALLGSSRYAILQEPSDGRTAGPKTQTGQPSYVRLKLGDTLDGFKLSEIDDKKVIFTKGASRIEVPLDFFRRVEESRPGPPEPTPPRPGVAPRIPRPPVGKVPTPQAAH